MNGRRWIKTMVHVLNDGLKICKNTDLLTKWISERKIPFRCVRLVGARKQEIQKQESKRKKNQPTNSKKKKKNSGKSWQEKERAIKHF